MPAPRAFTPAHKPVIKNPIANEFLKRKEEFARNKAKGNAQYAILAKPPQVKRDDKTIYEEKLRKIRLQNYNNRRLLNLNNEPSKNSIKRNQNPIEPDHRIKKMEALKVNA